jgi:hypothetical protein
VEQAATAFEQARLRIRSAEKFSLAEQLLLTARGLMQASGGVVARHKAERFASRSVLDLCCGIGGDLMAFAARGPTRGVDSDPVSAYCAAHNARAATGRSVDVLCQPVERTVRAAHEAVHLDPDRRPDQMRTVDLVHCQPGLSILERIWRDATDVAIKLAPATLAPEEWLRAAELEWIGHRSECKQQVAWGGSLARHPGCRVASVLANDGASSEQIVQSSERFSPIEVAEPREFLVEPHAAVFAAGLEDELAVRFAASRLSSRAGYLTASEPIETRLAGFYEIMQVVALRAVEVQRRLKELKVGIFDIKTRGLHGIDLAAFRRIRADGPRQLTLVLTRIGSRPRALLCRRWTSSNG